MAGQIIISNIKTDSDNTFSILANTGTVIFSANIANGITTNIANTKITGTITAGQLATSLNLATNNVQVASVQTATGTQAITFAANGWTGVGTTSPAAKFHVNGDMQADNFYCTTNGVVSLGSKNSSSSFTIRGSTAGVPDIAQIYTNNTERVRVTAAGLLQFDSDYGSVATAYGCRAWVNFNGNSGTIRASGNVSSVTRNGGGDYTINFTNAMPDINYCVSGVPCDDSTLMSAIQIKASTGSTLTTSVRITTIDRTGSAVDRSIICVNIIR